MDKEKFEIMAMDFMSGEMSNKDAEDFREFLEKNPNYQEEYNQLENLWKGLDAIQTPTLRPKWTRPFTKCWTKKWEKAKESKVGMEFSLVFLQC